MVTYQRALFIVSFSHLPQINYLLTVVTVRNESNDATEEMTDHVVTEKEAEIHSRRLSRLCQVIQQEWWGIQACMLHPRCMHGGGKVRLSRGHERRGAGGVQQALHLDWSSKPHGRDSESRHILHARSRTSHSRPCPWWTASLIRSSASTTQRTSTRMCTWWTAPSAGSLSSLSAITRSSELITGRTSASTMHRHYILNPLTSF